MFRGPLKTRHKNFQFCFRKGENNVDWKRIRLSSEMVSYKKSWVNDDKAPIFFKVRFGVHHHRLGGHSEIRAQYLSFISWIVSFFWSVLRVFSPCLGGQVPTPALWTSAVSSLVIEINLSVTFQFSAKRHDVHTKSGCGFEKFILAKKHRPENVCRLCSAPLQIKNDPV